ncbi:ABC transporter substrate-binding protein [Brevibacillus sp. B_LB10_24]|uniref:ABC transporter substrate-binding protein n=1 Tax=Brevibacillus sp. B_LB10_24 TaxID=3380645 RepID=UPI0038BA285C
MKKSIRALFAAVTVAMTLVVTACGSSGSAGSGSQSGGGDIVKIGMIADLSGKSALSGKFKKMGAELAVEEINADGGVGGKKLQLVIEDNLGTQEGSVSAFQKLVADPDIVAVIGSIRSTNNKAMDQFVKKAGVPVAMGGTNVGLTKELKNKWYFRFRPHDGYAAESIANFTADKLGLKKIAIVYDTDAFGTGGKDLLLENYKKKGITPVDVEGYTTGTKDFTPFLENIRKSGAEAVNTYMTNSEDAAQMVNQIRQLGLNVQLIGSPSIAQEVTLKLAGDKLNGVYSVNDFALDQSPETIAFVEKFRKKYGENPDVYTAWAYDALHMFSKIIAENGTDPEAIRTAMLNIKDYKGAEGTYSFDEYGDGLHSYSIVKVENGKIVTQK